MINRGGTKNGVFLASWLEASTPTFRTTTLFFKLRLFFDKPGDEGVGFKKMQSPVWGPQKRGRGKPTN